MLHLRKVKNFFHRIIDLVLLKLTILVAIINNRWCRLRNQKTYSTSAAILFPPSPNSLGDQSLLAGLLRGLSLAGYDKIGCISLSPDDNWPDYNIPFVLLGTINSISSGKKNFAPIINLSRFKYFYVIGADVLDGKYSVNGSIALLELAELASQIGLISSIVSFSFNENPNHNVIMKLKTMNREVRFVARDPISLIRFRKETGKEAVLGADLAFLMEPSEYSDIVQETNKWLEIQKMRGRLVIGLNINHQVIDSPYKTEQIKELLSSHHALLKRLEGLSEKISYLFIPHDFRGSYSDQVLLEVLTTTLPEMITKNSYMPRTPYRAEEVRTFINNVDLLLTGRMHLAIHALRQSVPVGCITYQGKFSGLYEHFNLAGLTIDPYEALNYEKLFDFVISIIRNRFEIRNQISSRIPCVIELAMNNIIRCLE